MTAKGKKSKEELENKKIRDVTTSLVGLGTVEWKIKINDLQLRFTRAYVKGLDKIIYHTVLTSGMNE